LRVRGGTGDQQLETYQPYAHPLSRKAIANMRVRNAPTIVTTTPAKISCGEDESLLTSRIGNAGEVKSET
jgi:hypothetical protein